MMTKNTQIPSASIQRAKRSFGDYTVMPSIQSTGKVVPNAANVYDGRGKASDFF